MVATTSLLLGLMVVPAARSSAFVLFAAPHSSFTRTLSGARGSTNTCVSSAHSSAEMPSMSTTESAEPGAEVRLVSRAQFSRQVLGGVAAAVVGSGAVGGLGAAVAPALADSTGKYSSKATARKRYLPRIVKMVTAFVLLKKDIEDGSANAKSSFFMDLLPDSLAAMDLYGSSMKKSETPDKKSKALQQLAQDFGDACRAIAKSVGKKGGSADASKAYDKATSILTDYLTGTELDPIGSDVYK